MIRPHLRQTGTGSAPSAVWSRLQRSAGQIKIHEPQKKPPRPGRFEEIQSRANYSLASALGAQHSLVQPSAHFFSPLLAVQLPFSDEQAAFLPSAFLALHPQESHAKTEEPATNNAIAAILIILFMVVPPICTWLLNSIQLTQKDRSRWLTFKTMCHQIKVVTYNLKEKISISRARKGPVLAKNRKKT
jgi:hypothetical protein